MFHSFSRVLIQKLLLVSTITLSFTLTSYATPDAKANSDIYSFKMRDIDGVERSMSQYKGQVLLIVNTASQCGFTPQLEQLQELQAKYADQGFTVLAFPSNDFKQDSANNTEIKSFMTSKYKTSFPVFEKTVITGKDKNAIYRFLTEQKRGVLFKEVSWNFEKFLISRDGQVLDRYNSTTRPNSSSVVKSIEDALKTKK